MKKLYFVFVVSGLIGFFGCGKQVSDNPGCTNMNPFSDSAALLKFADDSIKPIMDSSGMFYQIVDPGSGAKPSAYSRITVSYVGRLLNSAIFDSATNINLNGMPLDSLIIGWRLGMPKIGAGGRIKLLIPSAYAWGCTGYGPVPPNAPVYFDIRLLSVY
jgi:FKBP-type peptidyl-prolyl cis-trans isomerase FkpA